MKKVFLFLVLAVFICGSAFAAVGLTNNGSVVGTATDLNCGSGTSCSMSGSVGTVAVGGAVSVASIASSSSVWVDAALYSSSARNSANQKTLCIDVDGTIYASANKTCL